MDITKENFAYFVSSKAGLGEKHKGGTGTYLPFYQGQKSVQGPLDPAD